MLLIKANQLTENDWKNIYQNEYVSNHKSGIVIAKELGCKCQSVYKAFKRYNLPIRDDKHKGRHYHCNYRYFKDIDTEDKAYFFGFIYADGFLCVPNKVGISIIDTDYKQLEKLEKCMDCNYPIKFYANNSFDGRKSKFCRLIISDDDMVRDVKSHGLIEHKTCIMKPPVGIPNKLIKHFIRGFWDGNGTLYTSGGMYYCGVTGTQDMVTWIGDTLVSNGVIESYGLSRERKSDKVKSVKFGGKSKPLNVLYYLYHNANYYLDRKHDRYLQYMAESSYVVTDKNITRWTLDEAVSTQREVNAGNGVECVG